MKTKISFIILAYNDGEKVIKAVDSIKNLKTKCNFDIYVVDNGSSDGTPELIGKKFPDVNLIGLGKNIGTAAYNNAVEKLSSKYIFFTGCDIEAEPNMLDKLVDFLETHKDVAQAAPKYVDYYTKSKIDIGGTWLSKSFYSGTFKSNILGNAPVEIPYMGTGLIRTGIVKKFCYLVDKDYFFYGEDVDLGLRLRLLGYKICYIPDSIVYHKGSVSRNKKNAHKFTYLMERNLMTVFFKILSSKNIILLMPYVFSMRLAAIIKDALTFNFLNAFARLKAILWLLPNFSSIVRKRREIQGLRKVDDSELFKLFSEKYIFRRS